MGKVLRILYTFPSCRVHLYFCKVYKNNCTQYFCSMDVNALLCHLQKLLQSIPFPPCIFCSLSESLTYDLCAENTDSLDPDSLRLIDEIHECLQQLHQRGVSLRTVREALLVCQHVSPLVVTEDNRIILPDYNHQEIPLPPLPKSLYFLYLRHPEGIPFKCLSSYRAELFSIYCQLCPNSNPSRLSRAVDNLVDSSNNSLNEKISLIRRAFLNVLDEHLAAHYIISGEKGENRRILLSQHYLSVLLSPLFANNS